MKTLIFCIVIVGVAGYVAGQSTQTHLTRIVYSPGTEITASDITYSETEHTTYARGNVRIVSQSSTITADEADLHHLKDTSAAVDLAIDLRGNVHVVVAPSTVP
jgi:lipopolysaccharide assembly outer membrane protein LptD (OstA)